MIVAVEPSTAVRQGELAATCTMIERTQERLDLWPERLTADTAYGSAEMLNGLVHGSTSAGSSPHPRVRQLQTRGQDLLPQRFRLRPRRRRLHLPRGQAPAAAPENLPSALADENGMLRYWARKFDCEVCAP